MHCRSGPRPRLPVSQPRMKVERVVCASLRGALIPANGTIETVPVGSLRAPADRRVTTLTGLLRSAGTRYTGGVRASERPRYNPTQGPPKKRGRSSLSLGPSGEGPRGQMSAHHGSLRLFARPPARLHSPHQSSRASLSTRACVRAYVCPRTPSQRGRTHAYVTPRVPSTLTGIAYPSWVFLVAAGCLGRI